MSNIRLLFIEDNEAQQLAWKMIFEQLGDFKVLVAQNGVEGLEKIKENIDIIVLDMSLPKLNGIGFLDKLHTDELYEDCRNIPVVSLTVWSDLEDVREKCKQYNVELISKEKDDEHVVDKIKIILAERSKSYG